MVGICPRVLGEAVIAPHPVPQAAPRASERPVAATLARPPVFPVLSRNPEVIDWLDWLRAFCLVVGVATAAFIVRAARYAPPPELGTVRRFWRIRMLALALGVVSATGTEYEKIGTVVTLRLPINAAFLILSLIGLVGLPSVRKADRDAWLEEK